MAEFDQFGQDYRERLEAAVGGATGVDTALKSKLRLLSRLPGFAKQPGQSPVIVDFGCGTGLLTRELARFSNRVIGVDVSLDSLRHAGGADVVLFDGARLPLRSESVSVIVVSCVFHHIPVPARPTVLAELQRVLEPNGLLVVFEHNPFNPVTRWVVNRCEFDRHAVLLTRRQARSMLAEAGFSMVMNGYYFAVPPVNDFLYRVDSLFRHLPLGAQYFCAVTRRSRSGDNGDRAC